MNVRFPLVIALLLAVVSVVHALPQDEFEISNETMTRTISMGSGLLRTIKLTANGEQILASPSVEFLLELDVNGKRVTLAPSDFEIKSVGSSESKGTKRIEMELASKGKDLMMTVLVRYYINPNEPYMQKSVLVKPFKRVDGASLRRIVVEDFSLKPELTTSNGGLTSVNAKSGKGCCFFMASLTGVERLDAFGGLTLAEDVNHPFDAAYETGRAIIGPSVGGAESADQALRDYLWGSYCAARSRRASADTPCAEVTLKTADAGQRVGLLTELATKCAELRKANPDQAVCLTLDRLVRHPDIHLLSVVDRIIVDLTGVGAAESDKVREILLRVFPSQTLRFTP